MSRRLDRVNELMKREISSVLQRDFEFPNQLVTVNAVEVTQDLKEAKVWIGVLGGDPAPVLQKLAQQRGMIQNRVMKRVVLKSTPVLDFRHDSSIERGTDVMRLLDEVDRLPTAPEEE